MTPTPDQLLVDRIRRWDPRSREATTVQLFALAEIAANRIEELTAELSDATDCLQPPDPEPDPPTSTTHTVKWAPAVLESALDRLGTLSLWWDNPQPDGLRAPLLSQMETMATIDALRSLRKPPEPTEVRIFGDLVAEYQDGAVLCFKFSPAAGSAGYFGAASQTVGDDDDLAMVLHGPFWKAVRAYGDAVDWKIIVEWVE